MNLREQEYICAVAKYKSMTKAARELNMTQAALSLFVKNVETRLGVPLFERYRKEMVPTYPGEMYLKHARRILEEGNDFNKELQEYLVYGKGRLRFGINSKRSPLIVPQLLMKMRERYPNVDVMVKESDTLQLVSMLQRDELDCIYSYEKVENHAIHSELLAFDRIGLVISKNNPILKKAVYDEKKQGEYLDLGLLQNEVFLLYENDETRVAFDKMAQEAGFVPKVQEYYNVETMLKLTEMGYGIMYMNEMYVYHFRKRKEDTLRFLLTGKENDGAQVWLSYHERLLEKDYGRDFLHLIRRFES